MSTLGDDHDLLDRESVLREIEGFVRAAHANGGGSIVRITGPPGIGKTAILCAVTHAFGMRTRFVTAEAAHRTDSGFVAELLAKTLANNSPRSISQRDDRHELVACDLIVIDDVQWMDEQSVRIVSDTLKASDRAVILLGDQRSTAPEWPAHETIHLAPLRYKATLELVRRNYPEVTLEVAEELASAAEGVPLTAALLALNAASHNATRIGDAALSVAAVVTSRLGRLPGPAREAFAFLALADLPVSLHVLAHALSVSVDEVAELISALSDFVIIDNACVAFRHDALAAAASQSFGNPIAMYARLLAAYEAESTSPAAVVRCALACGNRERAASAALELARALAADGSLGTALHYARIGIDNAPHPLPVEYAVEYADILQLLSRDEDAAAFLRHAIRTALDASDAATAADLVVAFFNAAVTLERFTELDELCARIEVLDRASENALERVREARLASLAYAGRFSDYERLAATTRQSWIDARTAAFVHALHGDPARAAVDVDTYTAGLRLRDSRQQSADRILDAVITFFHRGRHALDALDALPHCAARHPSERALRGLNRICAGQWEDAKALLRFDPAAGGDADQTLEVRLLLAALSGDRSADEPALHGLRSMIRLRRVRHAVSAARWYVVAKAAGAASDIVAFVRETLEVEPMPYAFAGSPLSTARLSDRFGSALCESVINRYQVFDTPWHRAHHDLALGVVRTSHEHLRSARMAFDELSCRALAAIAGIELPIPQARDLAVARELSLLRPSTNVTIPLTPRERTIAEHTANGASNQEIAGALSISVRTVETHLTKIYTKLGISSRGALAAMVHQKVI